MSRHSKISRTARQIQNDHEGLSWVQAKAISQALHQLRWLDAPPAAAVANAAAAAQASDEPFDVEAALLALQADVRQDALVGATADRSSTVFPAATLPLDEVATASERGRGVPAGADDEGISLERIVQVVLGDGARIVRRIEPTAGELLGLDVIAPASLLETEVRARADQRFAETFGASWSMWIDPSTSLVELRRHAAEPSQALRGDGGAAAAVLPYAALVAQTPPEILSSRSWMDLMQIPTSGQIDLTARWNRIVSVRDPRRLQVPLGFQQDGSPLILDLKESAQGGAGPHGLGIGASGSGKSELLRTMALNLCIDHSPSMLNLLLMEGRSAQTFAGIAQLPHVVEAPADVARSPRDIQRLIDSIKGELQRRQALIDAARGTLRVQDHLAYERAREDGADLQALPALVILIDDCGHILEAAPEFMEIFAAVGRLGRMLGVHLAAVFDEGFRIGQLAAASSWKVALRTELKSDSRAAIGVPYAAALPMEPGAALLKLKGRELVRFDAERPEVNDIETALEQLTSAATGEAVDRWPISLDVITLDEVDPRLAPAAWQAPRAEDLPQLKVPMGKFDDPRNLRQPPWEVDLGGPGGHALVITDPQMGKSTVVMTLTTALAQLNHASQVQFYIIDYAGGGLGQLQGLPHVGAVVGRSERDGISRIIEQLKELRSARERLFDKHRINSMQAYRQLRRDQSSPVHAEDPYGDVFLVIDGYDAAISEGEALSGLSVEIETLMRGSLHYGIHIVIAASRTTALHRFIPLCKTVIEGYQSDFSVISTARSRKVEKKPGHAITFEPELPGLIALPRTDGDRDLVTLRQGIAEVVERVRTTHKGASAPTLKALPESITVPELFAQVQPARSDRERHRVPFGLRESTYRPAMADFWASPHMMILGEKASGKSELISTLIEGICLRYPTKQDAVIALFDPARAHSGEFARTEEQVACYGSTMDFFAEMEQEVLQKYAKAPTDRSMDAATGVPEEYRVVPPGVDAGDRSWWEGPEIFIIIDDYQIIAPRGVDSPAHALRYLMRQGQTRGIHVVVARTTIEYQVSAFSDPLIKLLLEEQAQTMLLSAHRQDVQLGEIRGREFAQPGRGQLVFRGQASKVQSAWSGLDRDEKFDD